MLDAIRRWLTPKDKAPQMLEPHLAATALLVEAALADGVYAEAEEAAIRKILQGAFGLTPDAAAAMLAEAEDLAEAAADHFRFTHAVKFGLPHDERLALVEHLWTVALSDGEKCAIEDAFIRKVAALLAVTDRERAEAKARAKAAQSGR